MQTWYKISQIDSSGLGEGEYSAKVNIKASQYAPDMSWEAILDTVANIKYNINIQYRTWGIADITVSCNDVLTQQLEISYVNDDGDVIKNESKDLTIDLSKIPMSFVKGEGIYIANVEIKLTPSLEIDYNDSSIEVVKGVL